MCEIIGQGKLAPVPLYYPNLYQLFPNLDRQPDPAEPERYPIFGPRPSLVFDYFDQAGGFAAIPLSERGGTKRDFDNNGLPICQAGFPMPLKSHFWSKSSHIIEHDKGRYACPLLFPEATGQTCPIDHKNWPKGGCTVTMPTCNGARVRHQLDRHSDEYKEVYKQRTATERVNSQAEALGIEKPKLRRGTAIANRNTLIYVLINLRAVHSYP